METWQPNHPFRTRPIFKLKGNIQIFLSNHTADFETEKYWEKKTLYI